MVKNTTQFIIKSKSIHGDTYNYTKTIYTNSKSKLVITCKKHGDFTCLPAQHMSGANCPQCAKENRKKKITSNIKEFVKKAKEVHGDTYDYSSSKYLDVRTKLVIKCKTHGDFTQLPSNHLAGNGCPTCVKAGWSYTAWEKSSLKAKNFDSFKLYIIKCWKNDEVFYKIGKTSKTIGKRFSGPLSMPYDWKVIKIEEGSARYISELEVQLHKQFSTYTYTPKIKFSGNTECFSQILIQ